MDKEEKRENRWAWLPSIMPGVSKLMKDERKRLGAEHVAECWKRGMAGEPGWFFACEGPVAIGTPWEGIVDLVLPNKNLQAATPRHALVFMREVADGSH